MTTDRTSPWAWIRVGLCLAAAAGLCWGFSRALRRELLPGEGALRISAVFGNAGGLRAGAPVRLAGVDAGRVLHVGFVRRDGRDSVHVGLAVHAEYGPLVRQGAAVSIDSLGVLGDKYVEIGLAGPAAASVSPGTVLTGSDPATPGATLKRLDEAVDDLRVVGGFFRRVVEKTEGLRDMWENFKKKFTTEDEPPTSPAPPAE